MMLSGTFSAFVSRRPSGRSGVLGGLRGPAGASETSGRSGPPSALGGPPGPPGCSGAGPQEFGRASPEPPRAVRKLPGASKGLRRPPGRLRTSGCWFRIPFGLPALLLC